MRRYLLSAGVIASVPIVAFAADKDTDKKGMPQLDPSSYPSQIFWLAVFFVAFYLFMKYVAMPRLSNIIEMRSTRISDDLDHATTASGDAEMLKKELDRTLDAAREDACGLMAAANDDIRHAAAMRDAALTTALTAKIDKAEAAIATARAEAMGSVRTIASGILAEALPKLAAIDASVSDIETSVAKAAIGKL